MGGQTRLMDPTEEQLEAIKLFKTGKSLAIEAGAGTGKTSTLVMIAQDAGNMRGQYVAFNKALVEESKAKFPFTVRCNTAHSLAYGAIGHKFAHRLRSSERMPSNELARRLGLGFAEVTAFEGKPKTLFPGFLASQAMKTVTNFCQSAAPEIGLGHVPHLMGIESISEQGVRLSLIEPAKALWEDIQATYGWVPFKHEHYLKMWQLDDPLINADYILFDECQPPGTKVLTLDGTYENIESLKVGDRVISYDPSGLRLRMRGSKISDLRKRRHQGQLVVVRTEDGKESRYTPEHKCMAAIGPALRGKFAVYLMQRGHSFRVGVTEGYKSSHYGGAGVRVRMQEEQAEAGWILSLHASREEALAEEAYVSWLYNLPDLRFKSGGNKALYLEDFWQKVGDLTSFAQRCLSDYGRDLAFPLWKQGPKTTLTSRPMQIQACNLLDGMQLADADLMLVNKGQRRAAHNELKSIRVMREPYDGLVYSLEVDGDHTYVADGLVTHNCQDANPVIADVIMKQTDSQLILTGDSQQELYAWTGAINAFEKFSEQVQARTFLTQSFRFGQAIADRANDVLDLLQADIRLTGNPAIDSKLELVDRPKAILTRTNAVGVMYLLGFQESDIKAHLIGGATDLIGFARAAEELQLTGKTIHPDLVCFDSWGAVQQYVKEDAGGEDLRLLVKLIDNFGAAKIIFGLEHMPREDQAEVVISTAHKAKGREWSSVKLAEDFPQQADSEKADLRLLYVAITRAKEVLDTTMLDKGEAGYGLSREDRVGSTPPPKLVN